MTQNQIRYLSYLEEQRANRERERENIRSNVAKEQENIRSNVARESETNRSNLENERLNREKLEFDKYGNSKAGGVVRTIKAVTDDISQGINEAKAGGPLDEKGLPKPVYAREGKIIVNPSAINDNNRDDVLEQLATTYRNYSDEQLSAISKKMYDQVHSGANHGKIAKQAQIYLDAITKVQDERKD